MRSKIDITTGRRGRKRSTPLPGGKALQRLFAYLGSHDPVLNNEVVAPVAVPRAARPKFGLTRAALKAPVVSARRTRRVSQTPARARSFAATIVKAATALGRQRRTTRARRLRASAGGVPAVPLP